MPWSLQSWWIPLKNQRKERTSSFYIPVEESAQTPIQFRWSIFWYDVLTHPKNCPEICWFPHYGMFANVGRHGDQILVIYVIKYRVDSLSDLGEKFKE